jgi:hypothetical protein
MVLRTAASTSTAILRPATTWITTLRTGMPSTSCIERLVGHALVIALQRFAAHQVHDQLEPHLAAHRGLAKDGANVEQADAAHLQQVLQQFGATALDGGLVDAEQVDRIVGHQAIAARYQLQPKLAFAQARIRP